MVTLALHRTFLSFDVAFTCSSKFVFDKIIPKSYEIQHLFFYILYSNKREDSEDSDVFCGSNYIQYKTSVNMQSLGEV